MSGDVIFRYVTKEAYESKLKWLLEKIQRLRNSHAKDHIIENLELEYDDVSDEYIEFMRKKD